jgi:signal recognition particle subunit SRP54
LFDTLQDRLSATFRNLRGKGRLSEADLNEALREIRLALLEADVNLAVVKQFIAGVREQLTGAELSQALNPTQQIVKVVNAELVGILGGQTREIRFAKNPPTVIMLAGLQGSGKTTLAGKLGRWLKENKHHPLLVACDLQRPNAVNQLQVVGRRANVAVFAPEPGNGVGDPVAVARASIEEAKRKLYDVVVVDTAGRLGVDAEMMQQAIDIRDAVQPDEILFVVDAMIGQDAVNTARAFADGVGFDGVVLSKLDGDARGGAALSIAKVTGRPIMFASNGENLKDFDLFHPDRMASRILDMGDLLTLIEKAEKTFDAEQAEKAARALVEGKRFGLDDFLQQMQAVRKMGPMSKILGMMPGMGQYKEQIGAIDEKEIDRIEAIIYSMTPAERANPDILNGSRRSRIAKGSGTTVSEVNSLVSRFAETRKMMQQLGTMGGLGLPGTGPARGRQQPARKKSRKGVSGNPARRAQVAAAPAAPADEQRPAGAFDEFGLPTGAPASTQDPFGLGAMDEFQLSPELAKMFEPKKK